MTFSRSGSAGTSADCADVVVEGRIRRPPCSRNSARCSRVIHRRPWAMLRRPASCPSKGGRPSSRSRADLQVRRLAAAPRRPTRVWAVLGKVRGSASGGELQRTRVGGVHFQVRAAWQQDLLDPSPSDNSCATRVEREARRESRSISVPERGPREDSRNAQSDCQNLANSGRNRLMLTETGKRHRRNAATIVRVWGRKGRPKSLEFRSQRRQRLGSSST